MSNALPKPDRSRPTRAAIPLLFLIGRVPFFSGLLGLDPCASAFPHSGVRSHRTLGALQSRSLQPPNHLCSPSRPARRTGRNSLSYCPIICCYSLPVFEDLVGNTLTSIMPCDGALTCLSPSNLEMAVICGGARPDTSNHLELDHNITDRKFK